MGEQGSQEERQNQVAVLEGLFLELTGCLPVFEAVIQQIHATSGLIEQSIVAVCGRFQDMAMRVQGTVSRTSHLLGSTEDEEDGESMQALLSSIRQTMQRVEGTGAASQRGTRKIEIIQQGMDDIRGRMVEVENIFDSINILGLNAMMEAVRAGEHGRAFAVVAKATRELGNAAARVSQASEQAVEKLSGRIAEASDEFRLVKTTSDEVSSEIDRLLTLLDGAHRELHAAIEHCIRDSHLLAQDIGATVTALQFQDRVSQQMGHVVQTLSELANKVAQCATECTNAGERSACRAEGDWHDRLIARCSMHSERDVLRASLNALTRSSAECDEGVELF